MKTNRAQRRAQDRKQAKLDRLIKSEEFRKVVERKQEMTAGKRDYAAYNLGVGVVIEALSRVKGIGTQRKAEVINAIKAIEAELGLERIQGDDPQSPMNKNMVDMMMKDMRESVLADQEASNS